MKTHVVGIAVAGLFSLGVGFTAFAQQPEPQKAGETPMKMGPEMMQQMMAGMKSNPIMAQCMNMCRTVAYPDSPGSLVALKEQLGLSEEQVKNLSAIEEKARSQAKVILTEDQQKKFAELSKTWKPESMMQRMQTMMPKMQKMMGSQMPCCQMMQPAGGTNSPMMMCPMMQMMQQSK